MKEVWEEERVVGHWKDAEVVPIPKKGDLQVCDNWRGISLLDMVGKICSRTATEYCRDYFARVPMWIPQRPRVYRYGFYSMIACGEDQGT